MKLHPRVAALLALVLSVLFAPAARATSLTLDLAAYSLHATDARLIGRITNVSGAASGTVSLRLYATTAPYGGSATSGYLMAQITPGTLSAGAYFPADNVVPLTAPPNGIYYASLLVVETVQTQDYLRAYYRWTSPISFGSLRFNNTAGWQSSGNSVRLYSTDGITNYSSGGRSTSYRVELWTFANPYTGVTQPTGAALRASYNFPGSLNALATLSSFDQTVPLTVPAAGSYYTALLLADMSSGAPWYSDYIAFPNQWVVTSPGTTVATPTIAPNGGTFSGSVQVSLACDTAGASIYYTDNGATPGGGGSTLYAGPFTLNASKTIKAIAIKSGSTNSALASAVFTINAPAAVAAPSVSPVGGNFTSPQTVTLSTTTAGAAIYYTTNGDTPSPAATPYTAPFPLDVSATVKAKAVKAGFIDSAVTTAAFAIVLPTVALPVISPAGGTFTLPPNVTISCATIGAQIFYGLGGELPETPYPASGGLTITSNTTLTAISKKSGSTDSNIASASFTISAKTIAPAFSPSAGSYAGGVTVTLSSLTGGATIRYTTDGSPPTALSTLYTTPFTLNTTTTVKAMAMKAGFNNSDVLSATYTITPAGTVATPHIEPGGGFYYGPVRVSLTTTTAGANVYYTTDGVTVPTESNGTLYTGPFRVYITTTLKVRAFKAGSSPSAIVTNSPITISNANNVRADSAWEVTEYRFPGNGTVTTLAQAETLVSNPNAAGLIQQRYQADVINRFDPDSPGSGGFFTGDLPFAVNNLTPHGLNGLNNGDDDNFILSARCAFLVFEAGDYTFGFSSDDGARLRITGAVFTGSLRLNASNPNNPAHNGDTLSFPVGTGNSDTLGYCNLSPGIYFLDFLTWENTGGAYAEVFAARGIKTSLDSSFRLVGHEATGGMAGNGITIPAPGWQVTHLKEGATNFNAALGRMYDWWSRKSVVTGIRFTSADDFPERDPMTFVVEGSTGHAGNGPWTVIASGNTQLPTTRGTGGPRINISNTTAWKAYRITFPTIRTPASANSMQVAEVEFYDADGLIMDLANGKTAYSAAIPSSNASPASQGAEKVLDGLAGTKYLNFDRFGTGFTLLPAAQIFSYLNLTDPDAGSGLHGHISFPFPGDGIGDDNNFVVGARATMNVPTAGDYTFCVLADDGIRLRIKGSRGWRVSSPNAAQTLPQTLSDGFQANGWGADVFGSVYLDPGSYEVEVIYDEIAGGAYMGVFSAWGRHTAWSSVAFSPLATINGASVEDDAPVFLRGPVSFQPPTNDDFDTALAIDGPVVHTNGNNTGAIMETNEPVQHGMTASIWWSWLAPATGIYIADTIGSEFDSVLAVYTNSALASLAVVATDATRGGNGAAKLTLDATAGTMYRIQAGTQGPGATGRVRLNIRPVPAPPSNDNFAAAMNLGSATAVSVNGTTDGATFQSGEPIVSGGWSVWHNWTAPFTGDFIINTAGSDFDTTLGVFTGTAHNALTLVAFNNNEPIATSRTSSLRFSAKAGTVYRLSVDGQAPPSSGNYVLNIIPVPELTSMSMSGSGTNRRFNLNWRSEPWQTYRIQESDNLGTWLDVQSCFGVTGTTAISSVPVPGTAMTRQFFRILRE